MNYFVKTLVHALLSKLTSSDNAGKVVSFCPEESLILRAVCSLHNSYHFSPGITRYDCREAKVFFDGISGLVEEREDFYHWVGRQGVLSAIYGGSDLRPDDFSFVPRLLNERNVIPDLTDWRQRRVADDIAAKEKTDNVYPPPRH